jgi:SAM-dependent methyltransferase
MTLAIPRALAAVPTGETDPIRFYSRPAIGWLFRRRIEMGLEMIPQFPPGARALEVGYGAGIVLYNLAPHFSELHGLDLDADPVSAGRRLQSVGVDSNLVKGSVLDMRGVYSDEFFDLVVCFSVMEHLSDPQRALAELWRVLKPSGVAIVGMPAVNRFMEYAFQAIGFKGIEDHHITTPAQVLSILRTDVSHWRLNRRALPSGVPFDLAVYHAFRIEKVA